MKIILARDEVSKIDPGVYWVYIVLKNGSRLEFPADSIMENKSVLETRPIQDIAKADVDAFAKAFQLQHKIPSEAINTASHIGFRGGFDIYRYEWVEITDKNRETESKPDKE